MLNKTSYPYLDSAQLFACVAEQDWVIFLDSGHIEGRDPRAESERFDVLAMQPSVTLVTQGEQTIVHTGTGKKVKQDDPLTLVEQELAAQFSECKNLRDAEELPAYLPGAYGYFSYDLARRFEDLPTLADDDEQLPEMAIGLYTAVVVIDHQDKTTKIVALDNAQGKKLQALWSKHIATVLVEQSDQKAIFDDQNSACLATNDLTENLNLVEYYEQFAKIRRYTVEGDCYQVNFAKRFSAQVTGDAWATYTKLRTESPAPFGAYIQLPFATVLSNSPESFIRCRNRHVTTSPIKGTRSRDHNDKDNDLAIANELKTSDKDCAENLIIVDLMRNDLSKNCELGSVEVPKLFSLHSFANVHHLISTVTGVLKEHHHALDLLRNCFPGGSITGAPKIRAMEIIEELEPNRRGLYCGSVGYLGLNGDLETSIAIRTIVIKDGIARFSAGGGLVIDSAPESEYQEILDKAIMMKQAIEIKAI